MPDLTAQMITTLRGKGFRLIRFDKDNNLQACKHSGDTADKKEWEDIENANDGTMFMRLPNHQELDLDSL